MSEKNLRDMSEKELVEKKNDLITRAEEVLNKAKAEKRELTEAEMAELAETRDNTRRIIKMLEEANLKDFFDKADQKSKQEIEPEEKEKMRAITPEQEIKETRSFENYIRGKIVNERAGELKVNEAGVLIPTTIANRIISQVFDMSPILERSTKYNITGKLSLP